MNPTPRQLDLTFYTGTQFPAEYRGNAFVVLKGSWNRAEPTGYKVVRVPFKDGRPEGSYQNFTTGFWVAGSRRAEVWGRPAAIAQAKDGSFYVADDTADHLACGLQRAPAKGGNWEMTVLTQSPQSGRLRFRIRP